MERIDLTKTIKEAAATFCQNRIGDKPPISVTVPEIMTDIPWPDRKLQELVKLFLYETLLTNDPDAEVTVSLRRRSQLKDLSEFVGVQPTYWLHLHISGRLKRKFDLLAGARAGCASGHHQCQELNYRI